MALSREDILRELELLPMWQQSPSFTFKQRLTNVDSEPISETLGANRWLNAKPIEANHATIDAEEVKLVFEAHQTMVDEQPIDANMAEHLPKVIPEVKPMADIDVPDGRASTILVENPPVQPEMLDDPILQATMTLSEGRREKIKTLSWEELQDCVHHCQACGLAKTRKQTVFGVGDSQADWLFVGEAPGAEEDKRGEPFVGAAGQLLDNMLAAIQLKRGQNVYIANVLKCRPPENRDPQGEEVQLCDPFLKRQVELIQPKLIVALGKFAAQSLLNSTESIARLRGQTQHYHGVPVIVTYHPAYLLRNLPDKAKAWEDLCRARAMMQTLQIVKTSQ